MFRHRALIFRNHHRLCHHVLDSCLFHFGLAIHLVHFGLTIHLVHCDLAIRHVHSYLASHLYCLCIHPVLLRRHHLGLVLFHHDSRLSEVFLRELNWSMNQRNHLSNILVFPLFSLLLLVHFHPYRFHQFITHRFYEVQLYNLMKFVFANRYWVSQKRLNLDHYYQLLPHLMALSLYLVTIHLVAAFIIWLLASDFQLELLANLLARLLRDPYRFLVTLLL